MLSQNGSYGFKMDIQYLKSVFKYAVSVLLSVIIIAYILYHMSGGFQQDIETTAAILTTKEETFTINATLMREETVLYSPVNGDVNYLYSDGERLAIHTAVAEIYSAGGSEEVKQQIIALDKKIRILESSNMSDTEKRTDTASTDKLIWKNLYSFAETAREGDVASASALFDDILIQLNRRRIITGSTVSYHSEIEKLKAEKARLSAQLSEAETTVVTDSAGFFYSAVDGYENIFSSRNISTLSYRNFLAMRDRAPEDFSGTGEGYPIGKLVTDYIWYTACEVSAGQLHNFDTGKYYDIKFPGSSATTINMYLYRILSEVGSDTAVLIFRSDILPNGFSYLRNQTVQIVQNSYTGYRVPVSSVRIENGVKGVYILRGSKVEFRKIEPLFEYDGYFIVKERDESAEDKADWLAQNDFVIVKGKDLYDGKIVN